MAWVEVRVGDALGFVCSELEAVIAREGGLACGFVLVRVRVRAVGGCGCVYVKGRLCKRVLYSIDWYLRRAIGFHC